MIGRLLPGLAVALLGTAAAARAEFIADGPESPLGAKPRAFDVALADGADAPRPERRPLAAVFQHRWVLRAEPQGNPVNDVAFFDLPFLGVSDFDDDFFLGGGGGPANSLGALNGLLNNGYSGGFGGFGGGGGGFGASAANVAARRFARNRRLINNNPARTGRGRGRNLLAAASGSNPSPGPAAASARNVLPAASESNPIPEPATLTVFGLGLAGLAAYGWRKRRRQRA